MILRLKLDNFKSFMTVLIREKKEYPRPNTKTYFFSNL